MNSRAVVSINICAFGPVAKGAELGLVFFKSRKTTFLRMLKAWLDCIFYSFALHWSGSAFLVFNQDIKYFMF